MDDTSTTVYTLRTPAQVARTLASRTRELRLARGWKQATLAERSGVSLASLRRFESTGKVSLRNLLQLAFVLNRLDDFDAILRKPPANSVAELEASLERPRRQRGRL